MTSRYYFNTNVTGHTIRIPCRIKRIRRDSHGSGSYLVDIEVAEEGFTYRKGERFTYGAQSVFSLDQHRSVQDLVKRGELYIGGY